MTKLEQITALANAGKAIEVATKSLQFACNTLLEVTRELATPDLKIVEKDNE